MNKKKLTQEMIDSGKSFEELGFKKVRRNFKDCEACGLELAALTAIPDEDGVMYESYLTPVIEKFLMAKYFTDIDTDEWDTEEGRYVIAGLMRDEVHDLWGGGWDIVYDVYRYAYEAMKVKHEHTSSLSYRIGKTFESVLGDGDIIKNLAQSREISEKLIDMLGIFMKHEKSETPVNGVPLTMFAKK